MKMQATLQILFVQHGVFTNEQTGDQTQWANASVLMDVVEDSNYIGCKPAKVPINDCNGKPSHANSSRLLSMLQGHKSFPVSVDVEIGQKLVDGKLAMAIIGIIGIHGSDSVVKPESVSKSK